MGRQALPQPHLDHSWEQRHPQRERDEVNEVWLSPDAQGQNSLGEIDASLEWEKT